MAEPIELRFDVTQALPAEATQGADVSISGWLFPPENLARQDMPTIITLLAGGSYDKRYHHAIVPGHEGYSAAEYLCSLGNVVLLTDHLGIGESTRLPDQKKATRQIAALANHAAVTQFFASLASGNLVAGLRPIPDFVRIGGGHSMGAMQTIVQQARHKTYDAVMIMGYTAEGVHMTFDGQKVAAANFIPEDAPDYNSPDRSTMHDTFHWSDVPADVIAADDALAVPTPAGIGLDSIRTHIVKADAALIDVPVYICLGERDVSPDPHAEPGYYTASPDVTLQVLPRSGHCQTFASTRREMWDRIDNWRHWIALRKMEFAA